MRYFVNLVSAAALIATQVAVPVVAAPGDRANKPYPAAERSGGKTRPSPQAKSAKPAPQSRPAPAGYNKSRVADRSSPGSDGRPKTAYGRPVASNGDNGTRPNRPQPQNYNTRPGNGGYNNGYANRPSGGNNTIVTGNTVVVPGNRRYPVYQTPGGGYYRPPNGGYYGPPRPPPGGWNGGYYPPPRYYYDDGPSVGDVIAGVAVTASLLALLSAATQPKQPQNVYVQGGPPPPYPAPYVPPQKSSGAPASINVDLGALTPEARPSASVCITEASRQIGATGGTEIRVDRIVDVEKGNGGYRFRLNLLGVYPDETRTIPMYCRATPEKIVELTFG